MRDIRSDLSQWLGEIRSQRAELDQLEKAVQTLLTAQEAHFERPFPLFGSVTVNATVREADSGAISEFLETTMDDGRPWSVDELVEAAYSKGIAFGDKNPKRVVNIMLVNMHQNKKVEKAGHRVWKRCHNSDMDHAAGDAAY